MAIKQKQWVVDRWKKVWAALRDRRPAAGTPSGRIGAPGPAAGEHAELLRDLRVAHREWVCARHRIDYAAGEDEIDYAIFALETAEKRYGMLLKQAKAMKVSGHGTFGTSLYSPGQGRTMEG